MEDTEYRNQRDLNQEIHCVSIRKTEEPAGNSEDLRDEWQEKLLTPQDCKGRGGVRRRQGRGRHWKLKL